MISMFRSVYSAILAVASGRVSSRPRTWSKLGALCAVLAVLLCGAGSIAPAQTISGNFGAVNIGTTSSVLPVVITFGTPGTIGGTFPMPVRILARRILLIPPAKPAP
jgi:hypothetical protein